MTNLEKYQQVFQNVFNVDVECLNDSFNFDEVDSWDSLCHITLIGELENTFDVMFETDDILHFGGYLNGINILKKYGVDF